MASPSANLWIGARAREQFRVEDASGRVLGTAAEIDERSFELAGAKRYLPSA